MQRGWGGAQLAFDHGPPGRSYGRQAETALKRWYPILSGTQGVVVETSKLPELLWWKVNSRRGCLLQRFDKGQHVVDMPRHLHAAPLVHELAGAVARWWWFTGAYLCEFARVDGGDEEGIGCATLTDANACIEGDTAAHARPRIICTYNCAAARASAEAW